MRSRCKNPTSLTGWAPFALLLALTSCSTPPPMPPAVVPPPPPMAAPAPPPALATAAQQQTAKLAYRHNLDLQMPAASVEPRYDRAVKNCLENTALNCIVMNASI